MDSPARRVQSLDALRGAVMILMALDHIRDFIHRGAMSFSPTDLARATPAIFFTRWITHFCAPVFMFAAGAAAFLWWQRNHSKAELARFLWTRGLWLILLELTVMRFAYAFTFSSRYPVLLLVLWALGGCMICLAGLVYLPVRLLAVLSVAVILLHNCLDPIRGGAIWSILHQPGAFQLGGLLFVVGYPLVPWFAVMAAGFCFGRVFLLDPPRRRRSCLTLGTVLTLAFVAVRALNIYGDPVRWSREHAVLSFLNCTKYPPSLDFLLMTLGPALLALAWLDRQTFRPANPLLVFGRTPLFYFVAHFYAAHLVAKGLALIRYGRPALAYLFDPVPSMGGPRSLFPPDFGYDLWVVYLVWLSIVAAMYPLCRRFADLRAAGRGWWWSYL
jgi:uncharacterized membrane protein